MSLPPQGPIQRLQVKFTRGEKAKYLSHLDLMRLWQRALRRADLPVQSSSGFNPHVHIAMAVPLAVGVRGEQELMDVFMARRVRPNTFQDDVNRCLPPAVRIIEVLEVSPRWPSLTSRVRFADYQVTVETATGVDEVTSRIRELLAMASIPRERKRDADVKRYDLRPLLEHLSLIPEGDGNVLTLQMRLRTDQSGSGRPDEVVLALGLDLIGMSVIRTGLVLTSPPAWESLTS